MRHIIKAAAVAIALFGINLIGSAQAAFIGAPLNLKVQIEHIKFDEPTLAPMAYTRFCIEYPGECKTRKIVFRGSRIKLTAQRMRDLVAVNAQVNSAIKAEFNDKGIAGEKWNLSPAYGDCNDYAVTKRHALLALGWPAASLLLAEVVTNWGEHHLVVVVRTRTADLVIDSLNANIKPWSKAGYRWVRMQTPQSPMYWAKIANPIV